jgi:hypothetical protein
MIDPEYSQISVQRQCELLSLPRSSYYYRPEDRRAVHSDSVLWSPADDCLVETAGSGGEPKVGTEANAPDGAGGDLSQTPVESISSLA